MLSTMNQRSKPSSMLRQLSLLKQRLPIQLPLMHQLRLHPRLLLNYQQNQSSLPQSKAKKKLNNRKNCNLRPTSNQHLIKDTLQSKPSSMPSKKPMLPPKPKLKHRLKLQQLLKASQRILYHLKSQPHQLRPLQILVQHLARPSFLQLNQEINRLTLD